MKEALKIICVIAAAMSVCDLVALFVYSIKHVPTGLSEGICYPFYIPLKMQIALIVRLIQIAVIVVGIGVFVGLSTAWHVWVPIVTAIVAGINAVVYCSVSY